jgi:endonuclease YncB( thermonuclease family)
MHTLELNKMGLAPINDDEMQEIDGGFIWFVLAGAALLITSCTSNKQSGHHNTQISVNCTNCSVTNVVNGDTTTVKVVKKH